MSALNRKQHLLLDKLFSFDSMIMDSESKADNDLKENLYNLFFKWNRDKDADINESLNNVVSEEERKKKEKEDQRKMA